MKVKQGYNLVEVMGEYAIVPIGVSNLKTNKMIVLNESAAFIWNQLEVEKTSEELMKAMLDEYNVSENKAYEDINKFLRILSNEGLLI